MDRHATHPQAIFLDRDGTLIENRHYLSTPEGVALLPGVQEALRRARDRRVKLFLFTNQSGVGRGYFTLADVEAVNRRMIDLLGLGDDLFARICVAPRGLTRRRSIASRRHGLSRKCSPCTA